jgi:ABC-2 type transport system ATP-binding protein
VGISGASYGGAISLLTAGYDKRVDAIAPQITWWNLSDSLFPQNASGQPAASGVFKKLWAGIFFTTGSTSTGSGSGPGSGASGCRFTAALCAMYDKAAVSGRADAATVKLLEQSSPSSVAARIKVPTLVVQGQNDSLFPLGQGNAIARAVAANGSPVSVDWTSGGHDGGDQESSRVESRTVAWFDRYLKKDTGAATGPAFRVTRTGGVDTTDGQIVQRGASADAYPGLGGTGSRTVSLTGAAQTVSNPAGGAPPAISAVPGIGALSQLSSLGQGLSLDFPGQRAVFDSAPLKSALRMTGSARTRITVKTDAPEGAVLFAKVYDVGAGASATLPHQLVSPLRVTASGTVDITLPALDYEFAAGHRLRLVLAATDLGYASPAAPATYTVSLAAGGAALTVPTDRALATAQTGLPVWTWALPLGALLAAAALLLTGRRRRHAPGQVPEPANGDVPLEISGLSKRYRGSVDRYAVRDLSFRVERGQVLGLLGPNGAGKTTTMRMLMGLIRPDAGTVRIFGQEITPGAPVLSRVGAFVEGAGFLPHLTGRANLDLYWRATGRPAEDAHADEALEIADLGEALDRAVRTYSQGMRQRLAIAQAMLGLPDLLILDEPTNGLDPPQIREMRAVVTRYAATGRTVIVSSHLLSEVEQSCTHLVVMDKGQLVAAGPVDEISGSGGTLFVGTSGMPAAALEETARKLAGLPGIAEAEAAEGGLLVRLDSLSVHELLSELLRLEVPVERVGPHRRLEDAFLTLIGGPA